MSKISVFTVTYNHESFIRACLDGAVSQILNCEYEIVVAEDCSTDGTLAICREYAAKYPNLIKLLETPVNLGMMKNSTRAIEACTGDYMAICEGDDYWTDPHKLQRQLDFLEANPDYSMAVENGLVINTSTNKHSLFNTIDECDLTIEDMLRTRQFPTASVFFRTQFIRDEYRPPKNAGDTFLWCYLATRGKIRYFPVVSSVYRRGVHGIVLGSNKVAWAQLMEDWNREISNMLPEDFDRSIFRSRNYSEYIKAFWFSTSVRDTKNALMSIRKCFYYQPLRTTRTLVKFVLGKLKQRKFMLVK